MKKKIVKNKKGIYLWAFRQAVGLSALSLLAP